MEEQFLIIKCGYEGIEKLSYLTDDPEDAKNKILSIRKDITDKQSEIKKFGIDIGGDYWEVSEQLGKLFIDEKISHDTFMSFSDNPDQYCVQKWNGKDFECCCKELGVEASETWLY